MDFSLAGRRRPGKRISGFAMMDDISGSVLRLLISASVSSVELPARLSYFCPIVISRSGKRYLTLCSLCLCGESEMQGIRLRSESESFSTLSYSIKLCRPKIAMRG
jgi:hypothetical protein